MPLNSLFWASRWLSGANAEDAGSISGLGRCPREGNGNPMQYSCLENPMDIHGYNCVHVGTFYRKGVQVHYIF